MTDEIVVVGVVRMDEIVVVRAVMMDEIVAGAVMTDAIVVEDSLP